MIFAAPQYVVLFHYFRQFLEEAHRCGIDVVPLKGAHLLTSVYPAASVERGPMTDVDFLVRPTDVSLAHEILIELGFVREADHALKDSHETAYVLEVNPKERIVFEMHEGLSRFSMDLEGLWRRTRVSTFDGVPCRRLSPEDAYVYAVLHETLHRLSDLDRLIGDLTMLLHSGEVQPPLVLERAREWRLTRAVWTVSRLVPIDKGTEGKMSKMLRLLEPPFPINQILRHLVPNRRGTLISQLPYRLQAVLLWGWILDSPTQVVKRILSHPVFGRRH